MATGYFEPSKGETPESIRRKRDLIRMLQGASRAPQNVGEGLSSVGDGIAAAILDSQADKAEGAGRDSANAAFAGAVGGGGYFPPAPGTQGVSTAATVDPNVGSTIDFARAGKSAAPVDLGNATAFIDPSSNPSINPAVLARFGGKQLPVSIRNNNMGAVSITGDIGSSWAAKQAGFVGTTPRPAAEGGYYAKYATPEHGVAAASNLLEQYGRQGRNTPLAITSKWAAEPGDYPNVLVKYLKAAGYDAGTNTPLDLSDPNVRIAILKAKSAHESGAGVPVYVDDVFERAVRGGSPAAPVQVASLDPSAGMMEAGPGMVPPPAPVGATAAPAGPQIAQMLSGAPEMAGNAGPVDPKGATIQQLMGAMGNQWLSEGQQAILKALLQQEMQKADPAYRIELEKAQIELDRLKNPQMTPSEKANYDLNVKKFGAEEAQRIFERETEAKKFGLEERKFGSEDADRTADNAREDQELAIKQLEYMLKTEPDFYAKYVAQEEKAGRTPLGILDYAKQLKQAGASNISVGGTTIEGEKKYDQTIGEGFGKRFMETQDAEIAARDTLTSLDIMERAMSDPNFYSGWGAQQLADIRRFGTAIGITDPDGVKDMETFAAQARKAALDSMGGSLGTGFSNADRDFVTGQVPGLENTPAGNKQLIDIMRKINGRKLEIAQMARDYAGRNKRIDAGFNDELAAYAKANPLFPKAPPPANKPVTEMTDEELEAIINAP